MENAQSILGRLLMMGQEQPTDEAITGTITPEMIQILRSLENDAGGVDMARNFGMNSIQELAAMVQQGQVPEGLVDALGELKRRKSSREQDIANLGR